MYLLDGVTEVRNFTGATDTALISDDDIMFYIENAESEIFTKTGIEFFEQTITEKYDGDGTNTLILKKYPVISINYLKIDKEEISSENYLCYKDKSMIYLKTGYFPEGRQNVEVSYTYGVPQVEDPIQFKMARKLCLYLASRDVLMSIGSRETGGITKEKLADYSIEYERGGMHSNRIKQLDKNIEDCYRALGIKVSARIF